MATSRAGPPAAPTLAPDQLTGPSGRLWSPRLIVVPPRRPTTIETLTRGRSVSTSALGLRTVRDDAGPIAFAKALVAVVEV